MNFQTEIGRIKVEYPVGDTKTVANVLDIIQEGYEISDGYHTFTELYAHRIALYISLCKRIAEDPLTEFTKPVWKSRLHSDGKAWEGWFILGIMKEEGKQITYHLPESYWVDTDFAETLDLAPVWDGHTPDDVIERLKNL